MNLSRLIAISALALSSLAAAVPVISEVVASPANTAGGGTVVIRGTGLGSVTAVTIGSSSAPITLATTGYIFCTTPPGQGRNLGVQVFEGPTPSNIVSTFAYDIPRVSNFNVNSSPTAGGGTLTITGSNFGLSRTVTIGGALAVPTGVNSHTQIQVIIPAGQGTNVPVVISCNGQTNIAAETPTFGYNAPTLTNLTPNGFTTAGGTATLTGTNLGLSPQVLVNGVPTTIVPGNTHTSVTFNVPAGSGTNVPVIVSVSGQISNPLFLSYPGPSISSILPTSGPTLGGNEVTIGGSNFGPGNSATILFDNQPVQNLSSSAGHSSIKFIAPPGQGAVHSIRVTVAGQSSGTFNYAYAGPIISTIIPTDFSIAGGDVVVISGINLGSAAGSVSFGGIAAPIIAQSHNSISCRAPMGNTPGSVPITVFVAGQASNSLSGNYICPADFNGDGAVDFFDYLDFVAAFSTPC